ncbi:M24 family metallopeptidase [Paenibacillus mucilaginosus]|uniref:Putative Xaa-Pro dipeptidase/Xaa-Pro aminopeptidase n=1 Tax=Paenibacillus mucilaginosus (strain KNP414) TaxID=1036673 RepID=F8FG75_PAEMK|nr:Xaa-Pro peptidase family protein [Paenibacillus mucilaginosus]AEI43895.1 putative Xaa-Pro dipeptidase/Xaa-Pro aminopeptidase [Paenibacillus mucilaginosus KNP414]MCG7212598.1 Xaa-Pro peptidase family protein [Paenibacillus mucilaginosus]WDM25375.1 aminopeptidase P family protein [Paenibacillus mucilaginosus]
MNERLKKLYALLEREGLDAAFITHPKSVYYFTGFYTNPHERFLALVCVQGEEPMLYVPALDEEKAVQTSSVAKIAAHYDSENPYTKLAGLLGGRPIRTVGLQEDQLSVKSCRALLSATGAESARSLEAELAAMRVIKDAGEIAVVRRAIHCIEEVFRLAAAKVKPGMTEMELVAEMEYQMRRLGSEGPSFETMVLSGAKSGLPHGVPSADEIREGQLLLLDAGVFVDGYASDLTRTFAVGEVGDEARAVYDAVLQANLDMIAAVRPGVPFGSLDRAARSTIESRGYGEFFITRAGHGFGLEIHEYPSIHGGNEDLLQEGMLFTAEPGIYIPGFGGVRIEDNVVVTADGADVLTAFPKELTVIGV